MDCWGWHAQLWDCSSELGVVWDIVNLIFGWILFICSSKICNSFVVPRNIWNISSRKRFIKWRGFIPLLKSLEAISNIFLSIFLSKNTFAEWGTCLRPIASPICWENSSELNWNILLVCMTSNSLTINSIGTVLVSLSSMLLGLLLLLLLVEYLWINLLHLL